MCTAFQQAAALSSANMLGFEHIFNRSGHGMKRSLLALVALTLCGFALACATPLVAAVATTIKKRSTNAHALGWLIAALVAD